MRRDARAYLSDVVDACDAIADAVQDMSLEDYEETRLIRSSVEREFTIIGEALLALSHAADEIFRGISHARRVVDFRNQLTHQYPTVDDAIVWAIIERDVPVLRRECMERLQQLGPSTNVPVDPDAQ